MDFKILRKKQLINNFSDFITQNIFPHNLSANINTLYTRKNMTSKIQFLKSTLLHYHLVQAPPPSHPILKMPIQRSIQLHHYYIQLTQKQNLVVNRTTFKMSSYISSKDDVLLSKQMTQNHIKWIARIDLIASYNFPLLSLSNEFHCTGGGVFCRHSRM